MELCILTVKFCKSLLTSNSDGFFANQPKKYVRKTELSSTPNTVSLKGCLS